MDTEGQISLKCLNPMLIKTRHVDERFIQIEYAGNGQLQRVLRTVCLSDSTEIKFFDGYMHRLHHKMP